MDSNPLLELCHEVPSGLWNYFLAQIFSLVLENSFMFQPLGKELNSCGCLGNWWSRAEREQFNQLREMSPCLCSRMSSCGYLCLLQLLTGIIPLKRNSLLSCPNTGLASHASIIMACKEQSLQCLLWIPSAASGSVFYCATALCALTSDSTKVPFKNLFQSSRKLTLFTHFKWFSNRLFCFNSEFFSFLTMLSGR